MNLWCNHTEACLGNDGCAGRQHILQLSHGAAQCLGILLCGDDWQSQDVGTTYLCTLSSHTQHRGQPSCTHARTTPPLPESLPNCNADEWVLHDTLQCLTIRLDVSTTAGKPLMMGLKRSWMSQTSKAVEVGSNLPRRAALLERAITRISGGPARQASVWWEKRALPMGLRE
jgi:hypothetical protein